MAQGSAYDWDACERVDAISLFVDTPHPYSLSRSPSGRSGKKAQTSLSCSAILAEAAGKLSTLSLSNAWRLISPIYY